MTRAIDYYERFRDVAEDEWWKLWIAYAGDPASRDDLPGFPPAEIQQRVHGTVFAGAMSGALSLRYLSFRFVRNVLMRPIVPDMQVLDFGCGWGRIQRVLLRDFPAANLVGTDIDPECIEIARQLLPEVRFEVNGPHPPLPHPDESFDLILVNSVFSHLAEPNFNAWIAELTRLLKTGGVLVFSSWGQGLLDMARGVFESGKREFPWQRNILNGFASYDELATRFASGDFVFAPTGGGKYLPGSDFGLAMVSRSYFEERVPGLALRDFLDDPKQFSQSLFFTQKVSLAGG